MDVGGRIESVNLKTTNFDKGFFPVAFSSTAKKEIIPNNTIFLGFDFTQRAPNAVELFADGPHHALENIETGDANLDKESSYNVSLGYNYNETLNKLKIEAYYNYIDDYIAADRNGNTQVVEGEDFNVVIHDQYNALFTGFEISGQYAMAKFDDFDFFANFLVIF